MKTPRHRMSARDVLAWLGAFALAVAAWGVTESLLKRVVPGWAATAVGASVMVAILEPATRRWGYGVLGRGGGRRGPAA